MALLNRLFPPKRKNSKQGYVSFGKSDNVSCWKPFNFSKEQVRILLFRECDARGRKLLFDSETVKKTAIENQQCSKLKFGTKSKNDHTRKTENFVEITNGYGYQYMRPSSDVTLLREMIFGSVAMRFRGAMLKVHKMNSPDRLLCTKVFRAPQATNQSKHVSNQSLEDSFGSSLSSVSESTPSVDLKLGSSYGSGPLDVPLTTVRRKLPVSSLEGDSGFCGDGSSSLGSSGLWGPDSRSSSGSVMGSGSGGSLSSLQRRWMRNINTSLELGVGSSSGCLSGEEIGNQGQKKTQLGLTIIINLTPEEQKEMELFFFEHMAVIESMVERLQWTVERAYLRKDMFVHIMMEGYQEMQEWLVDIFSAPRLLNPMWMSLMSPAKLSHGMTNRSSLAATFLRDLCQLIALFDTKDTNFFVSTLITGVLTHHLGWVSTVLPSKSSPQDISNIPSTSKLLNSLAKSHPYNVFWAQLGDLHGSLGSPVRLARTIVTSNCKKTELLNKLLGSLSYFIRCGYVERRGEYKTPSETELSYLLDSSVQSSSPTVLTKSVKCVDLCSEKSSTTGLHRCTSSRTVISTGSLIVQNSKESDMDVGSNHSTTTLCDRSKTCSNLSALNTVETDGARTGLYPDIENLMLEEENPFLSPKAISEKVSRLCRVPARVLSYHTKENDIFIKSVEELVPRKMDVERQMSSVDLPKRSLEEKSVVFVLGDNEELVGLKKRTCYPSLDELKCCDGGDHKPSCCQFSAGPGFVCGESGPDSGVVLDEQCVNEQKGEWVGRTSKVVTAHSSVIELEDECGGVEIKISEARSKSYKPVMRSQSLSFPLRQSAAQRKTKICRRHSELMHENGRYLKDYHSVRFNFERCDGVLWDYVKEMALEKSPLLDKKSLKMNEARGNFEQQEGCAGCSSTVLSNTNSIRDDNREGNALFDEYSKLSDEECVAVLMRSDRDKVQEEHEKPLLMLPLPRCSSEQSVQLGLGLASSLLGGVVDHYIPDLVLQGCTQPVHAWEKSLRRDLALAAHHPLLDQEISEAVCVLGNADNWEVQLISSHVSGLDHSSSSSIRVGMSQLVANMLESLMHLWRLRTPPEQCLLHLESKLRELCLRSQTLAELLLTTEFCDMASLTSFLGLEANDIPLLLAVASTHTPQVTQHYGLTFR